MTRREFKRVVAEVMESLPESFQPYLENLVVDVEQEPDRKDLTDEDQDFDIFGHFIPSQFDSSELAGVDGFDQPPHRIIIYQRPLEEHFVDREELLTEIRKTVIHELAHHFGWSERDLERFESLP